MPNGTYGGVRGRKTKVGGKLLLRFPPTRFLVFHWESSMKWGVLMKKYTCYHCAVICYLSDIRL
jgi:hypothetical protein